MQKRISTSHSIKKRKGKIEPTRETFEQKLVIHNIIDNAFGLFDQIKNDKEAQY